MGFLMADLLMTDLYTSFNINSQGSVDWIRSFRKQEHALGSSI